MTSRIGGGGFKARIDFNGAMDAIAYGGRVNVT